MKAVAEVCGSGWENESVGLEQEVPTHAGFTVWVLIWTLVALISNGLVLALSFAKVYH